MTPTHFVRFARGLVLLLLFNSIMISSLSAADSTLVAATDNRLVWMGRTAATAAGGRQMAYPGITLRFRYRGPAPTLRLFASSPECYFNLSINGWAEAVLHPAAGENRLLLPAGPAPDGGWEVILVRRTEAWQGLVTFEGLELTDTQTRILAPAPAPDRRLLVIGDSITTGHYVEQLPGVGDASPRTNNAERTWGWLLAQSLHAQVHIVAYGGRGLTRTWDGKTDVANAPQFFERSLPDDPAATWDHAAYRPQVVVIMLGQNDFNLGIVAEDAFVGAYGHFLARIHEVYPDAAVVLTGSPMQGDAPGSADAQKRAALYHDLDLAVARARQSGLTRIAVVPVSHQPGTAANAHPVVFQQEQIAAELAPAVRALIGW